MSSNKPNPHKELGFIALISVVIGSQIGSGTFVLPSLMAPFGVVGLFGWVVSVSGVISLALIFSELSAKLPKNGGPHVYVMEAFGRPAAFFTAWVYWIISWSSNSVLLVTTIYYLCTITGELTSLQIIIIEMAALFTITLINIHGVRFSGIMETWLTILKIVPLILLPILFFMYFKSSNFETIATTSIANSENIGVFSIISKTALLTCWGFIGVECATTPAERVRNPKKTIPMAIIIGTSCVALIYILNVISVIGVTGYENLINTKAPYAIAMHSVFGDGGSGDVFISLLAIIVCLGTLNAWTLTGGQIAQGAAADKLFPAVFGKVNKNGAPVYALLIAAFGIIPFFIIEQIIGSDGLDYLIGMLVSIFLFVYLISCIAYIKLLKSWKKSYVEKIKSYILATFATSFCVFVIVQDILSSLAVLAVFITTGIPFYIYNKKSLSK